MNAAFLAQWQIYRRGAPRAALSGLVSGTDSAFDADVAPGEIRVFADTNRPLVALVVEDRGLSGWRIVPVSPFCAPASVRELVVGERVFQLWNATVVSRRFAVRGWRVDALSADALAEVRGGIAAANPGRLTAGDGVQARYEREFLVGEGTLVPFAAPRAADLPRFAWLPTALKVAASVVLCLAAWCVLTMDSGRRLVRDWRDGFRGVRVGREDAVIELVDARDAPDEPEEPREVDIDFLQPAASWFGRGAGPAVSRPPRFADVRGPRIPEGIAKIHPNLAGAGYKSPAEAPMDVVFLSPAAPRADGAAPAKGGAPSYASGARPLAAAPKVSCRIGRDGLSGLCADGVLVVEGEAAEGAKATVTFDPGVIAGYRSRGVSWTLDGRRFSATYALAALPGRESEIGPASVLVTLIWPAKGGDERTPLVPVPAPSP